MMPRLASLFVPLVLLTLACGAGSSETEPAAPEPTLAAEAPMPTDEPAAEAGPVVVFLGDSLTAGLGLSEDLAYPALVDAMADERGLPIRVVNAGVSGDTTAGGARRIDWLLKQEPDVVVVALGGNDALRGLDPGQTEGHLRAIVEACRTAGARVLLAGMLAPPNLGPEYTERFAALYPRIAAEEDVALMPFLLEGVAADPALNQADGIHPNAEGQRVIARAMTEALLPLLSALRSEQTPADAPRAAAP